MNILKLKSREEVREVRQPLPPPVLEAFRAHDRCPKCLGPRLYPGLPVERFYRKWISASPSGPYLETTCPTCAYSWNELCADATGHP